MEQVKEIHRKKGYQTWKRWMAWGEHTGCHQLPERSFFFRGYQFPVCARCTGVIIGYILAVPLYARFGVKRVLALLGGLSMLTDWLLQYFHVRTSNNPRRLFTGILGGYGIMSIQLFGFVAILKLCKRFLKTFVKSGG
jgi:uncharacterized membrane protein